MDLQRAGGREALPAGPAVVLLGRPARRSGGGGGGGLQTRQIEGGAAQERLRLHSGEHGAVLSVWIGGLEQVRWEVPHLVCEQVLLEVPLGGEPAAAGGADERTLLGVAPVVDVQGALTGETLPTDVAERVLQEPLFSEAGILAVVG